jgi:hypothetical protein
MTPSAQQMERAQETVNKWWKREKTPPPEVFPTPEQLVELFALALAAERQAVWEEAATIAGEFVLVFTEDPETPIEELPTEYAAKVGSTWLRDLAHLFRARAASELQP